MANNPFSFSDPDGDDFGVSIAIAVGIGLLTNGIRNERNGGNFFDNWVETVFFSMATGIATAGIGGAFGGLGGAAGNSFARAAVNEVARAAVHAGFNGYMSYMQGGNFWHGAAAGGIGSAIGSGIHGGANALGWSQSGTNFAMVGGGALSGGIGSSIAGGSFWEGFGIAATVGLLNHAAHNGLFGGSDPDRPLKFTEGKSEVEMILFDWIGGGELITFSIGTLEMIYGDAKISSFGLSQGAGLGLPLSFANAARGNVVFHQSVSGNDLATIFNSAPYIRVETYGAFFKYTRVSAYTSNSFTNPVWSVRTLGVGFSAGVNYIHDKATFKIR